MATYMREPGTADMAITESLQCDACTTFDSEGFAMPEGRCWTPLWQDGREWWVLEGIRPIDVCVICGTQLVGRK